MRIVKNLKTKILLLCLFVEIIATMMSMNIFATENTTETEKVPDGYIGIYTIEDFNDISNSSSKSYILMENLDFSGVDNFEPIPTFSGILDGNGHTISGIVVESSTKAGIFFSLENAEIKNLTIKDSIFCIEHTSNSEIGELALAGGLAADSYTSVVDNVTVKDVSINGKSNKRGAEIGGIIGYAYKTNIINCESNAKIIFTESNNSVEIGGIVGAAVCEDLESQINNCVFKGNIVVGTTDSCSMIGGIAGSTSEFVVNCNNYGTLSFTGGYSNYVAGIASYALNVSTCNNYANLVCDDVHLNYLSGITCNANYITDCVNYGKIQSSSYSAGIAGMHGYAYGIDEDTNTFVISGCVNKGEIIGEKAAGIVSCTCRRVEECANFGVIVGTNTAAAIASCDRGNISDCVNYGLLKSESFVSGIAVDFKSVSNCVNYGLIQANSYGNIVSGDSEGVINCYYFNNYGNNDNDFNNTATSYVSSDFTNQDIYKGLDFLEKWTINDNGILYLQALGDEIGVASSISADSIQIATGAKENLHINVSSEKTYYVIKLEYEVLNPNIVSINEIGIVTGKAVGTTKIVIADAFSGKTAYCDVQMFEGVEKIEIEGLNVVEINKTISLSANIIPESAYIQEVTWKVEDNSIATVDENGIVTGVSPGKVKVVAKSNDGTDIEAKYQINVILYPESISAEDLILNCGESKKIECTILPSNATETEVVWESSDDCIATVDKNGIIVANAVGSCIITGYTENNIEVQCHVTVNKRLENIIIKNNDICLGLDCIKNIECELEPSDTTEKEILFSSSDAGVVTVDSEGKIKGISKGEAIITVSNGDGSIKSYVVVTVEAPVTKIILNAETNRILEKDSMQIECIAYSNDVIQESQKIIWKSSNDSVAIVSEYGYVTAINAGDVIITVYATDGSNIEASFTLNIEHDYAEKWTIEEAATCTTEGSKSHHCLRCDAKTDITVIDALEHNYKIITVPATTNSNGSKTKKCSICDKIDSKETIYKISSIKLSNTEYTYNGYKKTPSVTVKDSKGNTLVEGEDYKLTYSSSTRKMIGRYSVKVTFKDDYSGSKILYFTIGPKNPSSIKAVLYGYDDVKVSWSKVSAATGYKVYYKKSTSSTWSSKLTTETSVKLANLLDGVKYDIKVVAYKTVNGIKCYNEGVTCSIYTLKKVSGVKVVKSGSKVKVSWTNIPGETGYQISQSTDKNGTNIVATYKTTTGTYKTISATKGKTYYYKVRAYKVVNGKKIYAPWSTAVKYVRK